MLLDPSSFGNVEICGAASIVRQACQLPCRSALLDGACLFLLGVCKTFKGEFWQRMETLPKPKRGEWGLRKRHTCVRASWHQKWKRLRGTGALCIGLKYSIPGTKNPLESIFSEPCIACVCSLKWCADAGLYTQSPARGFGASNWVT